MLVLTRKQGEEIVIGPNIILKVIDFERGKVRFGITAPKDVTVHRREVWDVLADEGKLPPAPKSEL